RIGLLINNRIEFLEAAIGATAAGAVAVPFSTWSKEAELAYLLAASEVAAVIAIDRFGVQDFAAFLTTFVPEAINSHPNEWRSARFPKLKLISGIGAASTSGWTGYDGLFASEPLAAGAARPEDDCFILYTSGSSARPKAVRLQH